MKNNLMGINNLSQLINKDLYQEVSYETFSQKKIAIDAPYIMFKYNIVHGDNVVKAYINLLIKLRTYNIHPIFIFDGEHPPEKLPESLKRKESKATLLSQIRRLEADLEAYEEAQARACADACAQACAMVCQDHTLDCSLDCTQAFTNPDAPVTLDDLPSVQPSDLLQQTYEEKLMPKGALVTIFNSERMREHIGKLKQRTFTLKASDVNLCKNILTLFKIPFDQAPGEAEIYCTKLCKEGYVSAVLSADTDIIAAGCPVILRDITSSGFKGIFLSHILDDLELTQAQWLDLCILCGTDFNKNIPLIGPKKALHLIKTYQRLEDIPLDTSILNYRRVRELYLTDLLPLQRPYNFIPYLDGAEVTEVLRKYNLSYLYNSFKPLLK
jgi:5'-3' exonuclease